MLNNYYFMRHGESQANAEGIICSDPDNGVNGYGLTAKGRAQAATSAENFDCHPQRLHIIHSDFLRARQTAEIVHSILQPTNPLISSELLRERCFGRFDGSADSAYSEIWQRDAKDPDHHYMEVESVSDVLKRTQQLLTKLEQTFTDADLLLVAHGDVLQILQTSFSKFSPAKHRQLPHLGVAEIRQVHSKR